MTKLNYLFKKTKIFNIMEPVNTNNGGNNEKTHCEYIV